MRSIIYFVAIFMATYPAAAAEQSFRDRVQSILPSITAPTLPDLSLPSLPSALDLSGAAASAMRDSINSLRSFTQQMSDTLPILEEMGFEVSTFRVQWTFPPAATLRLRSKAVNSPDKLEAISAKATGGALMKAVISGAAEAKRIQSNLKLGTAILDVDVALNPVALLPKVRMHFVNEKAIGKDGLERDELLDLLCAQSPN